MAKRTHDSNDQDSSKATKTSRKSLDATCVICGDRAIGFNYDVLSCASCKAFFRRNANKNKVRDFVFLLFLIFELFRRRFDV